MLVERFLERARELTLPHRKAINRVFKTSLYCGTLAFLSVSCSPKSQSYIFGSHIDMGSIPSDVCKVNGEPKILGVSTESEGDMNLIYVRNNGDVVSQHYGRDLGGLGGKYSKVGEFVWTGGACPPSSVTATPNS